MITSRNVYILFFIACCVTFSSCKKDLDHELNSNIYDSAYEGPDPVIIEYFQPVYSQVHMRNVLRIKLKRQVPLEAKSKIKVYKDHVYVATTYADTSTIVTDFYILPGQTASYQAFSISGGYETKWSVPKFFTMY